MPNWCNNYIVISGTKSNMKPIYDFFHNGQKKVDDHYEKKHQYLKENPDKSIWDHIEGFELEQQLVMSTLVPHDEEYERIKESGEFIINPQDRFYGTKWDFDLSESNVNEVTEERITLSPSTAWSPPSEFCEKLTKKYGVHVEITYEEGGVGFVGQEEFEDGEMIGQVFYDNYYEGLYHLEKETFWSMVDSELDDLDDITEEEFVNKFPYVSEEDKENIRIEYRTFKVE